MFPISANYEGETRCSEVLCIFTGTVVRPRLGRRRYSEEETTSLMKWSRMATLIAARAAQKETPLRASRFSPQNTGKHGKHQRSIGTGTGCTLTKRLLHKIHRAQMKCRTCQRDAKWCETQKRPPAERHLLRFFSALVDDCVS